MKQILKTVILIFIVPIILFLLRIKIETLMEWNKIRYDYEIINNIVIEYYDENSDILVDDRRYMAFRYDESYSFLITEEYIKTKQKEKPEMKKFKIDLTAEQQASLKNIANFYPQQEVIFINDSRVDYSDEMVTGAHIVMYVRKKYKVDLDGFTHLTGNWYLFRVTR